MKSEIIARKNYYRFCQIEGNEYIASEFALETILRLIQKFRLQKILEIGMGIGSISDTILKFGKKNDFPVDYTGTEANDFCLNALPKNVQDFNEIDLYSSLSMVPQGKLFDLVIIDGQDQVLKDIKNYCHKKTIIFIEGDRSPQRELILSLFPRALHVNIISMKKNKPYAHGVCMPFHYVGGGQLIFTNPNLFMELYWAKKKLQTYIIRRRRKIVTSTDDVSRI